MKERSVDELIKQDKEHIKKYMTPVKWGDERDYDWLGLDRDGRRANGTEWNGDRNEWVKVEEAVKTIRKAGYKISEATMPTIKLEKLHKLNPEVAQEFEDLCCELSPENLSCDGEASNASVARTYKYLKFKWKQLEKQIGFKVEEF
jgi:hypothetical protein